MSEEQEVKLPKQWRRWCQKAGLKPQRPRTRDKWTWFYLVGKGRQWRVDCNNNFDVSVDNVEFDRWARSYVDCRPLPKTEAEFLAVVKELREIAKDVTYRRFHTDEDI